MKQWVVVLGILTLVLISSVAAGSLNRTDMPHHRYNFAKNTPKGIFHANRAIVRENHGIRSVIPPNRKISVTENRSEKYISHSRFKIDGDNEFRTMAKNENWSGNGTADSPYIIENYSINGNYKGYGIFIANTTVYFIIRNNYIYNVWGATYLLTDLYGGAVVLSNVTNGQIVNNTMNNCMSGAKIWYSSNNTFKNNLISKSFSELVVRYSSHNLIENNTVLDNGGGLYFGIYLYNSPYNTMYSNTFNNASITLDGNLATFTTQKIADNNTANDLPILYYKNISQPTTISGSLGGLIIGNCSNVIVRDIRIENISYGIEAGYTSNITFDNVTDINLIHTGNMAIGESDIVRVYNSYIKSNEWGLETNYVTHLYIFNSKLENNGITMMRTYNSSIVNTLIQHPVILGCENITFYNDTGKVMIDGSNNITFENDSFSSLYIYSTNVSVVNCSFSGSSNPLEISSSSHVLVINNTFEWGKDKAIYVEDSKYVRIENNIIMGYGYGIWISGPSQAHDVIYHNFISWTSSYAIYIESPTTNVLTYENSFYYNHGSNDTYDSSRIQAYNEYPNTWNTNTVGNFWSDWTEPDDNHDGIVDKPYIIAGGTGARDFYPLTNATYPLIGRIWGVRNQMILTGVFNYTVWGRDYSGNITTVEWYINGSVVNTEYVNADRINLTWKWDTTSYSDGKYSIYSILYDNYGRIFKTCSYKVIVDNTPPEVNITAPTKSVIRDVVPVEVSATDGNGSGIKSVNFYVDGVLQYIDNASPYVWIWDTTQFENGMHQLKVIAIDYAGFTSDAAIRNYEINNTLRHHKPIRINNNSDFYKIAAEENWSGNGTAEYPFYIEFYEIDANHSGSAIYIGNTSLHFVIRHCIIKNATWDGSASFYSGPAVYLYNVKNGSVVNNAISNGKGDGVFLYQNSGVIIMNNTISNYTGMGIEVYSSSNILIKRNYIENLSPPEYFIDTGIIYTQSSNVVVSNNTCINTGIGIYSYLSTTSKVYSNTLINCSIYLFGGYIIETYASHTITTNNTVNGMPVYYYKNMSGGNIPSDAGEAIIVNSTDINVGNLRISNATLGVEIAYSKNISVYKNNFSNMLLGVQYMASSNITVENSSFINISTGIDAESPSKIANNYLENNIIGIRLLSYPNKLYSNKMINCSIFISGDNENVYTDQKITEDNTVNGKPVYYYKNMDLQNATLTGSMGELILGNITHAIISNMTFSNASVGIEMGYTSSVTVKNVTVAGEKYYGVYLAATNGVIIENSILQNNSNGMYIGGEGSIVPENNVIMSSKIRDNSNYGILIEWGNHNMVINNTIARNGRYGVYIVFGEYNKIYRNLFYYNNGAGDIYNSLHIQARSEEGPNYWYEATSYVGNYWHDWANNNDTNDENPKNGIVDWPYKIDGQADEYDYYPVKNSEFETAPSPPQNLKAIVGNNFVNLSWSTPANNGGVSITEYRIYRNGLLIKTVPATQLWYNDTSVTNGQTYTYYVTAVNSVGESEPSNKVQATPGSAVPEFSAGVWMIFVFLISLLGILKFRKAS